MKLYYAATSPYVRKVMMVLHVAEMVDRVELIEGGGSPVDPNKATVGANPLGKVPCLVTQDGLTLYDSRVITRFLDAQSGLGLYPPAPGLWHVLTMEALAEGILDAAILCVYEARLRPEEMQHEGWTAGQRAKIGRATQSLEREAGAGLTGDLSAAQIATGAALGYVDFRLPDLDWRATAPALAAWYESFAERPFMTATTPPV